jgi:superfamily I DNA/RNA helicase
MLGVTDLLTAGAQPSRILVCTFTRTAASDLRREIAKITYFGAQDIVAGTLHAYCFSMLGKAHVLEVTGRVPRPLLEFELPFFVADMAPFGGVRLCEEKVQAFNAAWARLQSDEPGWPEDEADRRFGEALRRWLVFHRAILIGELVPLALGYLRRTPLAAEHTAFDHVLVDEYQDLNRAEQVLLDVLGANGSVVVVGDPDQSIYAFKYAHPEGIIEFADTHAETDKAGLTVCRRCPRDVVVLAESLIANNQVRSTEAIVPRPENPAGEVHIVQWDTLEIEAESVARFIKRRLDAKSVKPGGVLVLSPRRQFGYAIRNALRALDVHAHSFFNEEALDGNPRIPFDCSAQEAFSLLTLVADPNDRVALRSWIGFGSATLRERGWREIRARSEQTGASPRDVLQGMLEGRLKLPFTKDCLERFGLLRQREESVAGLTGAELLNAMFPDDQEWAEPFRAAFADKDIAGISAPEMLDALTVAITRPELPTDVDYVRVMSLHKSKGLTADLVAVVGCVEGLLPAYREGTIEEQQRNLEEQRRLFYVALTRTRQTLILSSVRRLPRKLAHRIGARVAWGWSALAPTVTSRFLTELGPTAPDSVTALA